MLRAQSRWSLASIGFYSTFHIDDVINGIIIDEKASYRFRRLACSFFKHALYVKRAERFYRKAATLEYASSTRHWFKAADRMKVSTLHTPISCPSLTLDVDQHSAERPRNWP